MVMKKVKIALVQNSLTYYSEVHVLKQQDLKHKVTNKLGATSLHYIILENMPAISSKSLNSVKTPFSRVYFYNFICFLAC